MNFCSQHSTLCELANAFGYCQVTACTKYFQNQTKYLEEVDAIIFPQTIGDITFYSSKELVKWVEDQQKINKDPNYGIGNWYFNCKRWKYV